ncbi:hypothetical protein JDV09_06710 [Mycobacterium sp. Y57]|uniref:hypothetical protein n=1 Tax=Mycolicibacterium xanthum TaxID=2796469 RepID=UPI001C857A71|nr:hypothetical protein [Mycolicibacterium xanthum]MBX7431800.1 hypothetical protein [Mycolicibacterium xanthum]
MSTIEAMIVLAGSTLVLCTVAMSVMSRAVRREHGDWVDTGRNPEDEPGYP